MKVLLESALTTTGFDGFSIRNLIAMEYSIATLQYVAWQLTWESL